MARDSSYRKLHYAQRPAKNVERKMIVESLAGLEPVHKLERFRYIGFGSLYFTDFLLMHRHLGLQEMVSIEKDEGQYDRARFEANRPFNCVAVEHGMSSVVLTKLHWATPTIVWLDYDDKLHEYMLEDIELICRRATTTTVLLVSVSVHPEPLPEQPGQIGPAAPTTIRVDAMRKRLKDRMPDDVTTDAKLNSKRYPVVSKELIRTSVDLGLRARRAPLTAARRGTRAPTTSNAPSPDDMFARQFLHFHYADNARMLTMGFVLFRRADESKIDACNLLSKPWARGTGETMRGASVDDGLQTASGPAGALAVPDGAAVPDAGPAAVPDGGPAGVEAIETWPKAVEAVRGPAEASALPEQGGQADDPPSPSTLLAGRILDEPFEIEIPMLSTREVLFLDRYLPGGSPDSDYLEGIPRRERDNYEKLYRHLPSFVDAVL